MSFLEIRKQNAHSTSGSPNGLNYTEERHQWSNSESLNFLSVTTTESIKSSLVA